MRYERKWRIRPAHKRDGGRMPKVFDVLLPKRGGHYAHVMSIEEGMAAIERIERRWQGEVLDIMRAV